jgi:hypothetical protein
VAESIQEDRRPFAATLHDLNKGRTHAQLGDELAKVVAAVVETGKAGSITLKLDVKRQPGDYDAVTVAAKVTSKAPIFDAPASTFYVADGGGLGRTPPHQSGLFEDEFEGQTH